MNALRILLVICTLICSVYSGVAGNLIVLPMQPKAGEKFTIEYTPEATRKQWLSADAKLHVVLYQFSEVTEGHVAKEIPMQFSNGKWTLETTQPEKVLFTLVKVGNGTSYDVNNDVFWDYLTSGSNGRPVKNAYMLAATSWFGTLPAQCKRKEDFQEVLDNLNEEIKLYPANLTAKVNKVVVQQKTEEISTEEAKSVLREVLAGVKQAQTPSDAIAIDMAQNVMGNMIEGARILAEAAERFPQSKAAETLDMQRIGQAQSLIEFLNNISKHLEKYPNSTARENLYDAAVNAATQSRDIAPLIPFFQKVTPVTAMHYHGVINYLGAVDSLRTAAFDFIERGINAAAMQPTPATYGVSEWKEQQRIATSLLYFVKGAIFRAQGSKDEAIVALRKSAEIGGRQTDKGTLDMLAQFLALEGKNAEAKEVASNAIRWGSTTQGVLDVFRNVSAKEGLDSTATMAALQKLKDEGRSVMAERLSKEMLNLSIADGSFVTLDGKPVKLSDWKGKVVFIDYWATWCGPCRQSFPGLQKLYEKYRNNPNVVFAVVNVWEKGDDRAKIVKDFLASNKNLTFPMFLDKTDKVVASFGVTGIPTKFFLGKDGKIQFKEVGFLPEEQFVEEASNRFEVLLGM